MKNRRIESHRASSYSKEEAYLRAEKRLKELKGFYWHAFWYVAVNIFIITMVGINNNDGFWHFGTFTTAFFWGIGLAFHALSIFGKNLFFSKNWEQRKIQEFMDKDRD